MSNPVAIRELFGPIAKHTSCTFPGCTTATCEYKPFCPEHVLEMLYASHVAKKSDDYDAEIADVAAHGWTSVDEGGELARDVMLYVHDYGVGSAEKIARECLLDVKVVQSVCDALLEIGVFRSVTTKRRVVVYQFADDDFDMNSIWKGRLPDPMPNN